MRWVRPDPMLAKLREAAQELEGEIREEDEPELVTWTNTARTADIPEEAK